MLKFFLVKSYVKVRGVKNIDLAKKKKIWLVGDQVYDWVKFFDSLVILTRLMIDPWKNGSCLSQKYWLFGRSVKIEQEPYFSRLHYLLGKKKVFIIHGAVNRTKENLVNLQASNFQKLKQLCIRGIWLLPCICSCSPFHGRCMINIYIFTKKINIIFLLYVFVQRTCSKSTTHWIQVWVFCWIYVDV